MSGAPFHSLSKLLLYNDNNNLDEDDDDGQSLAGSEAAANISRAPPATPFTEAEKNKMTQARILYFEKQLTYFKFVLRLLHILCVYSMVCLKVN